MVKLKAITGSSWLLMTDDGQQKIGILSENHGGYMLLAKETKTHFATKDEINQFFAEDVFTNLVENTDDDTEYFVKGYSVNFDKPHEVDSEDVMTDLPLYAKTAESDVYHCAGYYCIMFPKGWVYGFCPKYSTLSKYEYRGPFKTEDEVKSTLSILRKKQKSQNLVS